ncbi:MAG: ATP-binding cassette domain-containing protein [Actinomycetota bacterium]|nr:ATP-binding cassette domain-containing protein [Actinomycetota bacterium]
MSPHPMSPRRGEPPMIDCDGLVRIYKTDELEVIALQSLDLRVWPAELVTIVGSSGSGKSTLLNILGGMDEPTAGRARVGDTDLMAMSHRDRIEYRRHQVGFVWQQTARNLVPYLSAAQNVELPLALAGTGRRRRRSRALELLDLVGLAPRARHRPAEMSGGEQQRVAIAVALANEPDVLLADEPTGELDSATATEVIDLLRHANAELGVTGVIVTHDPLVSSQVDRTLTIRDGRVSAETLRNRDGGEGTEFVVLDREGRLQLPEQLVSDLGLADRVRVEQADHHVEVWPEVRREH